MRTFWVLATSAALLAGCGRGPQFRTTNRRVETPTATYEVGTPLKAARSFADAIRYKDEKAFLEMLTAEARAVAQQEDFPSLRERLSDVMGRMQHTIDWHDQGQGESADVRANDCHIDLVFRTEMWKVAAVRIDHKRVFP
jgi:hypothetical protein